jgi:uncharacterized protein
MQVLLVPGLRDRIEEHWQTILQEKIENAISLTPMGRGNLSLEKRIDEMESMISTIDSPIIAMAHSGGCWLLAHWASRTKQCHKIKGALLAVPPDFESPMPSGYPSMSDLQQEGWLPIPRKNLPFRSIVAVSHDDPLCALDKAFSFASSWGSEICDLGEVGHLNPASNFGEWLKAEELINELSR